MKTLSLEKETVRDLVSADLDSVAGGAGAKQPLVESSVREPAQGLSTQKPTFLDGGLSTQKPTFLH